MTPKASASHQPYNPPSAGYLDSPSPSHPPIPGTPGGYLDSPSPPQPVYPGTAGGNYPEPNSPTAKSFQNYSTFSRDTPERISLSKRFQLKATLSPDVSQVRLSRIQRTVTCLQRILQKSFIPWTSKPRLRFPRDYLGSRATNAQIL